MDYIGGHGTKEGAKKNPWIKYLKDNYQYREYGMLYHEFMTLMSGIYKTT